MKRTNTDIFQAVCAMGIWCPYKASRRAALAGILDGVNTSQTAQHTVAMLALPDCQILDVVGPLEVFSHAQRILAIKDVHPWAYRTQLLGLSGESVTSSQGLAMQASASYRTAGDIDTLLVAGGRGLDDFTPDEDLKHWLHQRLQTCTRFGSVCSGALLLARSGLLDGKRVTTHWRYCEELSQTSPTAQVVADAIFVRDENIYTSAGVTAGMDLALAMVEADWGRALALQIAQALVLYLKRPGGQSQFSAQLAAQMTDSDRFRDLRLWMLENLRGDLSVNALAYRSAMSPRNFSRVFHEKTGVSPAHYVQQIRIDAARKLLSDTHRSILDVALEVGFGSGESMRRCFNQHLGVSPSEYRARFA